MISYESWAPFYVQNYTNVQQHKQSVHLRPLKREALFPFVLLENAIF